MFKKISVVFLMLVMVGISVPDIAQAADAVKLPSWASGGNLEQDLSSKGQKVANVISVIVGILGVLGMLIGAACFPLNKPEAGKGFVVWSGVGLVIAGSVYGIAAVFV